MVTLAILQEQTPKPRPASASVHWRWKSFENCCTRTSADLLICNNDHARASDFWEEDGPRAMQSSNGTAMRRCFLSRRLLSEYAPVGIAKKIQERRFRASMKAEASSKITRIPMVRVDGPNFATYGTFVDDVSNPSSLL